MTQDKLHQALSLTIDELSKSLSESIITKQFLALELAECQASHQALEAKVTELEKLLDGVTTPMKKENN